MVIAILKSNKNVQEEVEQLMAKFDENMEVESYEKKCWCMGREAQRDADKKLDKKMGTWDEVRDEFHKKYKDKPEEETIKLWQTEIYKPRQALIDNILKNHPLKDSPDPKCNTCNGTGKETTTYNPDSKWDWYRIGGRWDGVMCGLPKIPDDKDGFNFGDEYTSVERNICPVTEIKSTPFALVTPQGHWIERGDMGWWGIVTDEKDDDDWEKEFEKIKKAFDGYYAVSLDCHI
jgi:hypothetical protein